MLDSTGLKGSEAYALSVADNCDKASKTLSVKSVKERNRNRFISGLVTVSGLVAIFSSYFTPLSSKVAGEWSLWLSIVAAFVFFLSSAYSTINKHQPPERYEDFSLYLGNHSSALKQIVYDDTMSNNIKKIKLQERISLAEVNLNDAKSKFAWLNQVLSEKS